MLAHKTSRVRKALAVVALAGMTGCAEYAPLALDPEGARTDFEARLPSDPRLLAFAERLAQEGRGAREGFDPTDGLDLEEAEVSALFFNPDLRRARARAGVSAAATKTAGAAEDPVLGFETSRILESVEDPWILGGTVGITIPLSGRRGLERMLAASEHRRDLAQVVQDEWRVRTGLRQAWVRLGAARRRTELLRTHQDRLDAATTLARTLLERRELLQVEARLFEIASGLLAVAREEAAADERTLRLDLLALIGLAPTAPVDLAAPSDEPRLEGDAAGRRSEAERRSPRLLMARLDHEIAERTLELRVAEQFPDLVLFPGLGLEDGLWRALFAAEGALPVLDGNRRAIAEADAARRLTKTVFDTELERLIGELATAEERAHAKDGALGRLERDIQPVVATQWREVAELRATGRTDPLLLLETLAQVRAFEERWLAAAEEAALARLDLMALVGPFALEPAPVEPEEESP